MNPTRTRLDASRWHWQHGPIDLILSADGDPAALKAAYDACRVRFIEVLPELVGELKVLRRPVQAEARLNDNPLNGPIARRMWSACHPHGARYITPMAAVAGSVADELIAAFNREGIERAYINNGGDIALYLTQGQRYRVGVFADHGLHRVAGRDLQDEERDDQDAEQRRQCEKDPPQDESAHGVFTIDTSSQRCPLKITGGLNPRIQGCTAYRSL